MPRYALKVEYNGAPFKGWQRQTDQITVQGNIEAALARLETRAHKIAAAGRTDAGVHAWGQVAHCDLSQDWAPFRLSEALNYHLKPSPIAIVDCARVSDEWHARFSAQERHYIYRVLIRRAPATHQEGLVWQVKRDLDIDAMNAGGALLTGTHDFTTFRSTICQSKSPVKTLSSLVAHRVQSLQGDEIHFDVRARSFLHNQVRSFVGSLEQVGAGSWTLGDLAKALAAKDRNACGPVSPSKGLYLAHVEYAEDPFAVAG